MKEVFMPSMDELYQIQELDVNLYKYIVAKAIESIICKGLNYPSKGMLKNVPRYLKEDSELAIAVCTLYPDEMIYSETARNDVKLAIKLMESREKSESGLNHLYKFDCNVLDNPIVLEKAILLLEKELIENTKYRFEYIGMDLSFLNKGAGRLLDDIFARKLSEKELMFFTEESRRDVVRALINIEPAYAISLPMEYFKKYPTIMADSSDVSIMLGRGINNYASRYGLPMWLGSEYSGKDILTNPDIKVKRLLKCINDRNK